MDLRWNRHDEVIQMSWGWGQTMAEQRIRKANDDAALAWLKRQDEEMEREREERGAGWYLLTGPILSLFGWCMVGVIGYLVVKLITWVLQ